MEKQSSNSFLTFRLQHDMFAISVKKVLEIIETGDEHSVTRLPKAPPYVIGVVNFRGDVIPVVDTRKKFDIQSYKDDDKFVIMILNLQINNQEYFIGAMADKVVDVVEINKGNIKPVPEVGKGYDSEFIEGVIHQDGRFVMLLNLEKALASDEIVNLAIEKQDKTVETIEENSSDNKK